MRKLLFFALAFIGMQVYYSCSSNKEESKKNIVATAEMSLTIDGMTCAAGCAKTIEKIVGELAGVSESKVNFDEKTATFKFDETITSEEDILKAITSINDGQYKVNNVEVKIKKTVNEEVEEKIDAVEKNLIKDTTI